MADYSAEHFEIACYQSLIAAADEAGHLQVAEICGQILEEERAMAEWLEQQIPAPTLMVLQET